jgi:hypothetical protein
MVIVSDSQIEAVQQRQYTVLRRSCERDAQGRRRPFIASIVAIMDVLETLAVESAKEQTLGIICHQILSFSAAFPQSTRDRLLTTMTEMSDAPTLEEAKRIARAANFKAWLTRRQVTVVNHLVGAYHEYQEAEALINLMPAIAPAALLTCLSRVYNCIDGGVESQAHDRAEQFKQNNKIKYLDRLLAQSLACNLLLDLRPDQGWSKTSVAARAIAPQLTEILKSHRVRYVSTENQEHLIKTITRWINKILEVNAAYLGKVVL